MSDTATKDAIRVACEACGKKFKVPASKGGKRGLCPGCGAPIVIPHLARPSSKPAAAPEPESTGDFDWDSLASAESSAKVDEAAYGLTEAAPEVIAEQAKPRGDALAKQMKSLTPAQRRALSAKAEQAAFKGSVAKDGDDQIWGFPSFLMGLTLAAVGALIGGLLWFWLLALTGKEIRMLAVGVGVLAGGGMFAGYQKHDMGAAFLAAFLAGAGIVLAKLAMVTWGQGYLVANQIAENRAAQQHWIDEEYEDSDLAKMNRATKEEPATQYKIDEMIREKGYDAATWYGALDQWRDKQTHPIYLEMDEADDATVERLYIIYRLEDEAIYEAVEAAEKKYREDNGLESEEAEYAEDSRLSSLLHGDDTTHDDRQNARKELQARGEQREKDWAGFEAIEEQVTGEIRAEFAALTHEEAVERYNVWREETREEQLAQLTAAELEDYEGVDEMEEDPGVTAFGFRDLFYIPIALGTAFGLGTGMRGDDD